MSATTTDRPPVPRLALNASEVAIALGLSRRRFRHAVRAREVPDGVIVAGVAVWPLDLLRAWLTAGCPNPRAWSYPAKGSPPT